MKTKATKKKDPHKSADSYTVPELRTASVERLESVTRREECLAGLEPARFDAIVERLEELLVRYAKNDTMTDKLLTAWVQCRKARE